MRRILCLFFLIALIPSISLAQVSATLPPSSQIYRIIDLFVSKGLIDDVIYGQRPYTRDEAARIVRIAFEKFEAKEYCSIKSEFDKYIDDCAERDYLDKLFAYAKRELKEELDKNYPLFSFNPLKKVSINFMIDTEEPRNVPGVNGQGSIDAYIASFSNYQENSPYPYGAVNWFGFEHEMRITPYFIIEAEDRFEAIFPRGTGEGLEGKFHVHRLYGATGWKNIRLEVGRDNLMWGQSEFGGLMISTNARPLDMIKLENPHPLKIPWIGHMKWTLFVSNLGPENTRKYPYFYGLKWSWKPYKLIEFGLSETIITGGEGAPKLKWWEPIP